MTFNVIASRVYISIHALLAESDVKIGVDLANRIHFYPRSPCGERHKLISMLNSPHSQFLSTLSLRRATGASQGADFGDKVFLSTLSLRRATPEYFLT